MKRRFSALFLALMLLCSLCVIPADAAPPANTATILFTHDLHSHFLPQPAAEGGESGVYARLKTAIDREREAYPAAPCSTTPGRLSQRLFPRRRPRRRSHFILVLYKRIVYNKLLKVRSHEQRSVRAPVNQGKKGRSHDPIQV